MNDLDTRAGERRYVRLNQATDELFEDLILFPEEADRLNARLAADGSEFRWMAYGTREEEKAA